MTYNLCKKSLGYLLDHNVSMEPCGYIIVHYIYLESHDARNKPITRAFNRLHYVACTEAESETKTETCTHTTSPKSQSASLYYRRTVACADTRANRPHHLQCVRASKTRTKQSLKIAARWQKHFIKWNNVIFLDLFM